MNSFPIYKKVLILAVILLITSAVSAQDLGSSNTLFGSKKKPAAAGSKKTPAKKPAVSAAKKPPAKPAAKPANTAKNNANKAKPSKQPAAKNTVASGKSTKSNPPKNTGNKPENVAKNQAPKQSSKPDTVSKPVEDSDKYTIGSTYDAPVRTPVRDTDAPVLTNSPKTKYTDDNAPIGPPPSPEFNELFERAIEEGNIARDERNYVRAEGAYLRAQSLKTGDARAIYGLGNLYSDQQRWEEAERAYRTAMKMDPSNPEPYIALSFVLTQPIAAADLAERYEEAEKMARRAIQLNGGNALAHDQLGVALELRGNIEDETENSYRKAIQLDGSSALAYAHLGRLLSRNGRTKESASAYDNAVRLAADVPTMILVADVMQSQQRYKESEDLLRRAVSQDPRNPTALMLLGRALTTRAAYDEAEKVLKKSADVSPFSFVSQTLLGSLYARQGKFDSAEKALTKAVRLVSPYEMKRLSQEFEAVGDGYLRAGKNRDAARVYRQALALDKDRASLASKLSRAEGS